MKKVKRICCLSMVVLLLICFSACQTNTNNSHTNSNTNNGQQSAQGKQYSIIATNIRNLYVQKANGFFETEDNQNGSANLMYTDYAAKHRVYLSTHINSSHDTKADTSFIEFSAGGVSTIGTDNKLYVVKHARPSMIATLGEQGKSFLEQADYNGQNHKRIYLKNNQHFSLNGGVAFDGENVIMIIYNYTKGNDLDAENIAEQCIIAINEKTGKIKPLYTFKEKGTFSILGADKDQLIISNMIYDRSKIGGEGMQTSLFLVNPDTGEQKQLDHIPHASNRKFIVNGDKILYYEIQTNSLMQADLAGNITVLAKDVIPSDIVYNSASLVADTFETVDKDGNVRVLDTLEPKRYIIKKADYWAGDIKLEEIKDDYLDR